MDLNEIISNLREALLLSPGNIPLRLQLAQTLTDAGQAEDAADEFRFILDLDPSNIRAKLGLSRGHLVRQNYSVAVIILEEILTTDPQNEQALLLLAKALLREGSLARAIETYKKLLALQPLLKDDELDASLRNSGIPAGGSDDDDGLLSILEKPEIRFADVGGMGRIKEEISLKIIRPLQHPELYKAYGKKVGGGILLFGPPGCGKTYLARATAGEVQARFINVGISDVLDMWIGNSEKNLHGIFELARENRPCVVFIDEVDALGASRSDMRQSGGRHLINQFLSELDGIDSNNEGILVMGATNAPWHLDPAFRRPGRFDRIIFVEPPDMESRAAILDVMLAGKPTEKVDTEQVARQTEDYSGADLNAVIDLCIEEKLSNSFTTGIPAPITTKDLLQAVKKHRPTTREWFNTAKNYALYANDSGLYDDILRYLKIKK